MSKLKEDLRQAYKLASETADKVHQKNKKGYDKRVCFQSLEIGDRVLLKNWGLKGKHKLQTRWSPIPYQVVGKMPNLPVYQLKKENGSGRLKTIHRDHILPIGQHVKLPIPGEGNNCCGRQKQKGKKPKQATVVSDPQPSQDSDSWSRITESYNWTKVCFSSCCQLRFSFLLSCSLFCNNLLTSLISYCLCVCTCL